MKFTTIAALIFITLSEFTTASVFSRAKLLKFYDETFGKELTGTIKANVNAASGEFNKWATSKKVKPLQIAKSQNEPLPTYAATQVRATGKENKVELPKKEFQKGKPENKMVRNFRNFWEKFVEANENIKTKYEKYGKPNNVIEDEPDIDILKGVARNNEIAENKKNNDTSHENAILDGVTAKNVKSPENEAVEIKNGDTNPKIVMADPNEDESLLEDNHLPRLVTELPDVPIPHTYFYRMVQYPQARFDIYQVQRGDSLKNIARAFQKSIPEIASANDIPSEMLDDALPSQLKVPQLRKVNSETIRIRNLFREREGREI